MSLRDDATMPITGIRDGFGKDIRYACPMWIFQPWSDQAITNHDQSLKRLSERGGLDVREAVAILTGRHWRDVSSLTMHDAHTQFVRLVTAATSYRQLAAEQRGAALQEPRGNVAVDVEALAALVHQAYLDTCKRLGWPVTAANRAPYAELSEQSKELDRATVRAVLAALSAAPDRPREDVREGNG